MGSPTVLAAQDVLFDAGVMQLFPLTAAEFTFKFDPPSPGTAEVQQPAALCREHRAALKYMMDAKSSRSLHHVSGR